MRRRALSNIGGKVIVRGDARVGAALTAALDVRGDERSTRVHVHGFHTYAARLHPVTASRLIQALSEPGAQVLDPFCGSGTVLIEALLLGRRALGVDANPLAVALSRLKTTVTTAADRRAFVTAARRVTDGADARRRARAGSTRRYSDEDRELFDPHVLLELDGLRAGIDTEPSAELREALALVLSSLLTKVSRQPGDTAGARVQRRLASGFVVKLFVKRAEELARQEAELVRRLPAGVVPARVLLGDARTLRGVPNASVDLVVTSPPYPGVYDYAEQHRARIRWLGLEPGHLEGTEIGARRELDRLSFNEGRLRWLSDLERCFAAMRRVLVANGRAALVVGDSTLGGRALRADEAVLEAARAAGLSMIASGSQTRPHFHAPSRRAFRDAPRREHAIVLGAGQSARRAATANEAGQSARRAATANEAGEESRPLRGAPNRLRREQVARRRPR